jgi:hypothetical protein
MQSGEQQRWRTLLCFSMPKLALANAALTVPSVAVVFYGASEEPFFLFDWFSFSVCVLAGGLLALSWVAWGAALALSVRARWHYGVAFVFGPWSLICLFYLLFGVQGYFGDLTQFEHLRDRGGAVMPR